MRYKGFMLIIRTYGTICINHISSILPAKVNIKNDNDKQKVKKMSTVC